MGKSEHHNVGEASNVNHLSTISWIFTFYSPATFTMPLLSGSFTVSVYYYLSTLLSTYITNTG